MKFPFGPVTKDKWAKGDRFNNRGGKPGQLAGGGHVSTSRGDPLSETMRQIIGAVNESTWK